METSSMRAPRCVAKSEQSTETKCFKSAQWSPDGTCLVTNSEDRILRVFVLPVDLLENPKLHTLHQYAEFPAPEPIYASAIYPFYNLSDPSTTLILHSVRDVPTRLSNPLSPSSVAASYPLICPTTEKYLTPHSLHFASSGSTFITGTDSLIALFDLSRPGEPPFAEFPTIPSKRKKLVGGGVGMKGIVSALGISSEGILAAGTLTRHVGLYGDEGGGDAMAVFSVASEDAELAGGGVTQTVWSPCGRYLYVAERRSDGVLVYDVRVAGRRLGWLKGRRARTNQRLGIEVVPTATGNEVWAGGTDGVVRGWENSWQKEGVQEPFFEWAASTDAVSSAVFHPSATIAATSSGQRPHVLYNTQRSFDRDIADPTSKQGSSSLSPAEPELPFDNTLRVWWFE